MQSNKPDEIITLPISQYISWQGKRKDVPEYLKEALAERDK